MEFWNVIILIIGIALIIAGARLKYKSPPLLGGVLPSIGVILSLYALLSNQQSKILANQEDMIRVLKEIRDALQ
jgi:hypothetical protein